MNENQVIETNAVEEVLDVANESSGKGWFIAGAAVLAGAIAFGAYKLVKAIKAKKEQKAIEASYNEVEDEEIVEAE